MISPMARARARKRPATEARADDYRQADGVAGAPLAILAVVLVAFAGLAAYANSLDGPFLFDDQRAIVQNASIRDLATALRPPSRLL